MAGRQIAESKLQPDLQFAIVIYISKENNPSGACAPNPGRIYEPCSVDMLPWKTGNLQERNMQRKETA
jgi:hypothetical protein